MQCRKENLKFEILQPNKGLASLSAQGDGAWARAVGEQCGEQEKKKKMVRAGSVQNGRKSARR